MLGSHINRRIVNSNNAIDLHGNICDRWPASDSQVSLKADFA